MHRGDAKYTSHAHMSTTEMIPSTTSVTETVIISHGQSSSTTNGMGGGGGGGGGEMTLSPTFPIRGDLSFPFQLGKRDKATSSRNTKDVERDTLSSREWGKAQADDYSSDDSMLERENKIRIVEKLDSVKTALTLGDTDKSGTCSLIEAGRSQSDETSYNSCTTDSDEQWLDDQQLSALSAVELEKVGDTGEI